MIYLILRVNTQQTLCVKKSRDRATSCVLRDTLSQAVCSSHRQELNFSEMQKSITAVQTNTETLLRSQD